MRRVLFLCLALLGLTVVAQAQSFPPEISGDEFLAGAASDLMFVPKAQFQVPYSVPTPEGVGFLTTLALSEPPLKELNVWVQCLADADTGECLIGLERWGAYPWNYEALSYCNGDMSYPDGSLSLDCYTFHQTALTFQHFYGYLEFTGSPPQWWDWGYYFMDEASIPAPALPPRPEHQPMAPNVD